MNFRSEGVLCIFSTFVIFTSGRVKVPVLSKQNIFNREPSTVFCGSVPEIPLEPNLYKEKEYARLNRIGKGGGAEDAKKSINLKKTNSLSMSLTS